MPGERVQRRETDVVADRAGHHQSVSLPIFGQKGDAGLDRAPGGFRDEGAFPQIDLARRDRIGAEDAARHLGAPAAHQAKHAEDFTARQRKTDLLEGPVPAQLVNAQHFLARLRAALGVDLFQCPAHHHPDQLPLARFLRVYRADKLAILQDGDAVGHFEDFIQPVGNVEDQGGLFFELPDQAEQAVDFFLGQHGRRLVQNENARAAQQRFGDLDHLLVRNAQPRDGRFHVHALKTDTRQDLLRLAVCARPIDPPGHLGRGQLAHQDVLGDGQVRNQAELLIHRADSQVVRLERVLQLHRAVIDQDVARIALDSARKNLDQGGFSGPVLSDDRVYLTCLRREIHSAQGLRSFIAFADLAHLEEWWLGHPESLSELPENAL